MAWIESHQELARHPKTRRLTRILNISLPATIGHLHLFWWWALDYAQDGDLSRYSVDDIADAAMWDGLAGDFVDAMCEAGFLDKSPEGALRIHDWNDYAGRLIEKRRQDAERKRKAREKEKDVQEISDGCPTDVQRTAQVTVPVPNSTSTSTSLLRKEDASRVLPPTGKDLIAELVEKYRAVPGITTTKGDFPFIGRLYNDYGYDAVLMALDRLEITMKRQEIDKPLIYLAGILKSKIPKKDSKKGFVENLPDAAELFGGEET